MIEVLVAQKKKKNQWDSKYIQMQEQLPEALITASSIPSLPHLDIPTTDMTELSMEERHTYSNINQILDVCIIFRSQQELY